MYRPPMPPPGGMRPPGGSSPGPFPPSGLPPPQRPPAGYRPSYPVGNLPPPGAPLDPRSAMAKPPIQMLANMSLDSNNQQQFLSNGIPDMGNTPHSPVFNGNQPSDSMSVPQVNNFANKVDPSYSTPTSNASPEPWKHLPTSDSFPSSQQGSARIQDSSNNEDYQAATSSSHSDLHRSGIPSNYGNASSSPIPTSNSSMGLYSTSKPAEMSGTRTSDSKGGMQFSRQEDFTNLQQGESSMRYAPPPMRAPPQSGIPSVNSAMAPPQPGMTSISSSMVPPSQAGMPPFSSSMAPSQPGMSPFSSSTAPSPQPGMPSFSSPMAPSQPGMPPYSSTMAPSQPGMPSFNSPMAPSSQPGMPSFNSPMAPSQPGMSSPMAPPSQPGMPSPMAPPSQPGMPLSNSPMVPPLTPGIPSMGIPRQGIPATSLGGPPPRPGMPPVSSPLGGPPIPGMPPNYSGMPPLNSPMGPPKLGMPPSHSMGPPKPGMPPMSSQIGPPRPGMPPPMSSQMGPPKPGMPHSDSQIGSPRFGMPPPGSNMVAPQSDMHTQMSGMPPPPSAGSYQPNSGPGLPSQQTGSQMGPGLHTGMPPAPGGVGQHSSPGMGGMQNRYPGAGPTSSPMGGYPQGSQGRRLNPDDMPSPLQVIEEDKQSKSGEFVTNLKGALPPLVTTDFVVKDGGNASPRFIRSTMYSVPATQDMMKQSSVPFGLVISPLAELHPEEGPVYMGTSLANGPVRCNRCKGYMSPLMMFMDGGRRFQCLLCKQINEVPADYYCHMDSQGARADKFQRPELCLGTYEFAATAEYCKDKLLPKEPAFIFVFEMSQLMVQRGIVNLLCQNMKSILKHLPKDQLPGQEATKSSVRVGFITYDSSVHFYKLSGLAPEMCIVCDKENMFVPVPDGVLCDVDEVADNIEKLMECIPQNFQTSKETSGALSCAIQAGMAALKASGRAGKLFVFHSTLSQFEGPGKLKNRDDRKLLGTEKEKAVLAPQNTHYNNLAQDLVSAGCGVDFYIFNETYIDLATIGQVARLTGGQCHKYTFFQANKDAERLFEDLKYNISKNIVFDSVMRVRTSTGVRPVEFFGHFFMSNTHDIELAVVDSSKAVVLEVKHDDKITEEDGVYIQVALLFTSVGGQRRLRIINLALNICTQMADLYKNCDLDTLMNFFGKQTIFKFLDTSAKQVKENLVARTAQILACYRKNCASPSSAGQLILPELMKLLPLYVNCLTKCDALSGGHDLACDDRSWHIYQLSTMNVESSVVYFYPRLIPLTDNDTQESDIIPQPVRTSYEKLSQDGAYLLENGLFMFMWVGSGTSPAWMKDVFGVSAPHQLDPVLSELPELDNPVSKQVRDIINAVREHRRLHVRLYVVPQQGKHEVVMRNYLVEDKGVYGAPSYVDFLCHVHKEIRALLS